MHVAHAAIISLALAGCVGDLNQGSGLPDAGVRGPDATIIDTKSLLRDWSGCMTLANFQAANMATAWGELTTNDGKQCQNCHNAGQYSFIATSDENAFFDNLSMHSALLIMYFKVDVPNRQVLVSTASLVSANGKVGHPKFNATTNPGITALEAFHAATVANTSCDPPRMVD